MAGSTYSTNLKIELMATGENSGTWGDITNTNLGTALEQAIVGYGNPDFVADANLTISITNSNSAQAARALVLNVTSAFGSLTQTRNLVVPTSQKQYIVQNNTAGGQSIVVKTSAGTGITVPNGRKAHLYVDGTNVIQMFDFVDINGGAIDGTPIGASSASTGAFTTLNASGATTLDGNVTLGNASGDNVTVTGTITSNLLFTDNTYDIGASGATRPRTGYFGTSVVAPTFIMSNLTSGRVVYTTTSGQLTDSANLLYSGTDLTVYGITVGRGAGAGATNTAVGASALASNTTGNTNTAFGYQAGQSVTTANQNTYIGVQAGKSNTGGNNTMVGCYAMTASGSGTDNTGVGLGVLANNTGSSNTALGVNALVSNTTASNNTAVGYQASYSNTTGYNNAAVGNQALYLNTTGALNTAMGDSSLSANTTGNSNTAVGRSALGSNTTASNNTAVGYQAGYTNSTGTGQTFLGYQAGYSATTGSYNLFAGERSGYSNTTGERNVALGYTALNVNTTGVRNVAVGMSALEQNSTGSYNIGIGYQALTQNTTASNNTAVGYQAGYSNTTGANVTVFGNQAGYSGVTGYITAFGYRAGYNSTGSNDLTAIGDRAAFNNTTGYGNTALGVVALSSNTTGGYNTALGLFALYSNTTASNNTAVGYQAGYSNTTGATSTLMGRQAGYSNTTGANTLIGDQAGYFITTGTRNVGVGRYVLNASSGTNTGNYNTAIGDEALAFNTTASNNTAVGYQAGYSNTTGAGNTIVGYQAGLSNTTGERSVFIGKDAGRATTTGGFNTFVGQDAGYLNTTGSYNTFVGAQGSGEAMTTGSKNTIIGKFSGNQGGLDIRTANNYIVLSDGDGNPRGYFDSAGVFNTGSFQTTNNALGSFSASKFLLQTEDTTTTRSYVCGPDTSTYARWEHYTTKSNGTPLLVQRWNASANIEVRNIGLGLVTPTTSGTGITFPATQSASSDANTLDDYEEGTWTPNVTIGGSSTGITYTARAGTYTKVGNLVQISFIIRLSSRGSNTGDVAIDGLPFIKANNSVDFGHAYVGTLANMAALNSTPFGGIPGNTATIAVRQLDSASAGTTDPQITQANISNTWIFGMTAVYTTST